MCGIALAINGTYDEASKMGNAIRRRGVKSNIVSVSGSHIYFTHLPIVDPDCSPQPYNVGKIKLWFNGFISNWKELNRKYKIEADNDTWLLTAFINKFGESKLNELNGFFSVVYYDGKFHCFTDRYGIKQLYKYQRGDKTYICSEVKGLLSIMDVALNEEAVDDWKYSLGVMTDNTIYKGIEKIKGLSFKKPYKIDIDYDTAKETLSNLFAQSMSRNKCYTLYDGIFLSGGIDSGFLAKELKPAYSFSMDYTNELSEIDNIKINSNGIHHTMICNDSLYYKYRTKTAYVLDDLKVGSCYTNFALTECASKFCTVLYSGAGADELFNGYSHRYNKDINDVIKRTKYDGRNYSITHKDYDWRYLRGILIVEDRMAGWHTMETRYPYLDNDLVDFVLSLPEDYLKEKRILKDVCGLDKRVVNGKKRGFSNPVSNDEWVKFVYEIRNTYRGIS